MDEKKQHRIDEVRQLLVDFAKDHLNDEISEFCFKLWEKLGKKRTYSITGGKKEIWASAVVYVIARLNFLFDPTAENPLTTDTICDFFGTKKGTVSAKATDIEKALKIRMGEEEFCSAEISDALTYYKLPNGMILSKAQAKKMGFL